MTHTITAGKSGTNNSYDKTTTATKISSIFSQVGHPFNPNPDPFFMYVIGLGSTSWKGVLEATDEGGPTSNPWLERDSFVCGFVDYVDAN